MSNSTRICTILTLIIALSLPVIAQPAGNCGGHGYREAADTVIKRLQLKPDYVIVDIGAGDGWWASKMAAKLSPAGTIHAAEVEQKKVDAMKSKWSDTPQIKPYLCPTDGTGMKANTCDLAFISKTFHHFDKDGQVDYLKHLKQIIKPAGKLVIIERHSALATGRGAQHGGLPGLVAKQAEEAGWMLLRCDLLPASDHFMAIFVQPETFAKRIAKRIQNAKK